MQAKNLKRVAATAVLVALVAVIVWQQQRINRMVADAETLRRESDRYAALQEENQGLIEQLRLASDRSRADASELARLRGQSARVRQMEQDNARLKADRERLPGQPAQSSPAVSNDQTPEWKLVQTRMLFSKVLGLSIFTFASKNDWQMPTNLAAAISSLTDKEFAETLGDQWPPDADIHKLQIDQFELVYQGNVRSTGRDTGTTMIARAKEPVQLSNGRWARAVVFDDGHAEVFVGDTLEDLAAKERPLMQAQSWGH